MFNEVHLVLDLLLLVPAGVRLKSQDYKQWQTSSDISSLMCQLKQALGVHQVFGVYRLLTHSF